MLRIIVFCIGLIVASPAWSDAAADCNQFTDLDLTIRGCTQLIDHSEDKKDLDVAFTNRAVAFEKKGDYDGAIADYSKALELDPKCANDYANRGIAYEAMISPH